LDPDKLAVDFLLQFRKLRTLIDDKPADIQARAAEDDNFRSVCVNLHRTSSYIQESWDRERGRSRGPIDKHFIDAWRDFELRFQSPVCAVGFDVFKRILASIDGQYEEIPPSLLRLFMPPRPEDLLTAAAKQGKELADSLKAYLDLPNAENRDEDPDRDFLIQQGQHAWNYLTQTVGLGLDGVFRRFKMIPWTLVPRHVANKHDYPGDHSAKASLFRHLQEAHAAFVFGAYYASIAMCRAVLELVLRDHYGAIGTDLERKIASVQRFPLGVRPLVLQKLRMRANAILHYSPEKLRGQNDNPELLEGEFLTFVLTLRLLIEGAPERQRSSGERGRVDGDIR
jgi:hypothetical protein